MNLKHFKHLLILNAVPSTFDVDAFAAGSQEGQGDTRRLQIEEKEYPAIIMGPWKEKTKLATTDKGSLQFVVAWQPDDPEQAAKLKVEKLPLLFQRIFLDLTEAGALDMGPFKNAELNKLRETFGMNKPGVKWSFPDFIGKAAKVTLTYRPNKDDPSNPFANITAVKPL